MAAELRGVTNRDGSVTLGFHETPDRVGVRVLLIVGDRVVSGTLDPDAWDRLTDRYGGPFSQIECVREAEADTGPEAVRELKEQIAQAERMKTYYSQQAETFRTERDAANKLAEERNPTFADFQVALEETAKWRLEAELQALAVRNMRADYEKAEAQCSTERARVEELEKLLNPGAAVPPGRRAMVLDDDEAAKC